MSEKAVRKRRGSDEGSGGEGGGKLLNGMGEGKGAETVRVQIKFDISIPPARKNRGKWGVVGIRLEISGNVDFFWAI